MRVNILDAGLKERAGHHYDFDRKLARHLAEAGHDVHVYAHVGLDPEIAHRLSESAAITPLFRAYYYDQPAKVDYYAGELIQFEVQSAILAEDLKRARDADLWIWPSMRAQHLNACVRAGVKSFVAGCIHEDPGIVDKTIDAMAWRMALRWAHDSGLRYAVGSIEPDLRHKFMPILPDGRFIIFPQPFDGPPIDKPRTELKRIGFFGQQRQDKGTRLMSRLLPLLVNDGYKIVLQDSSGEFQKLFKHPSITPLEFLDDLNSELRHCDLVVLPYDVAAYRVRGSGILVSCLSLGIPVAGPYGTIPGYTIERLQVGPLFPRTNSFAIHAAITYARENFSRYANQAFKVAGEWGKHHGVARFSETFLALVE